MVGVEQWAGIRRMYRVERLSIREISKRTGLHRKTIRRARLAKRPEAGRLPRCAIFGGPYGWPSRIARKASRHLTSSGL